MAESYGLRIRKNGVACCPFHDDRHPSMKVDKNYHCFACGVGGDVIDYTARMYGLSQYNAAKKLVEDFGLHVQTEAMSREERQRLRIVKCLLENFIKNKAETGTLDILAYSCY